MGSSILFLLKFQTYFLKLPHSLTVNLYSTPLRKCGRVNSPSLLASYTLVSDFFILYSSLLLIF